MRRGIEQAGAASRSGVDAGQEPVFPHLVPVPDLDGAPAGQDDIPGTSVGAVAPAGIAPTPPFEQPGLQRFRGMSVGEIGEGAGLKRIDVVAWRDFDDPEDGGSELHAHRVMAAWSQAGLDVSLTTSSVPDRRAVVRRDGYRVIRRAGCYSVFPRTILSGALGRIGAGDGLVEIWNGMPFFSPRWSRAPQIVFLHHVHAEMWKMVLPHGMAEFGHGVEHRLAPPAYRRSRILTLSSPSKAEIVERLRIPAERIAVIPPGVEPSFSPLGDRSSHPLVVAVGRLVPVKRFHLLIEALVRLKPAHLGGGLDLLAGGLGHDDHRGRCVRDAGRGHEDRWACRRGRRRPVGPPG